jgi:hypothetical protein
LYQTGSWPKNHLDHINGARADNRFTNLREASPAQNRHNSRAPRTNITGLKGASWNKRDRKWVSEIRANGKRIYLGYFDRAEDAHAAYVGAATLFHGDFARFE